MGCANIENTLKIGAAGRRDAVRMFCLPGAETDEQVWPK